MTSCWTPSSVPDRPSWPPRRRAGPKSGAVDIGLRIRESPCRAMLNPFRTFECDRYELPAPQPPLDDLTDGGFSLGIEMAEESRLTIACARSARSSRYSDSCLSDAGAGRVSRPK